MTPENSTQKRLATYSVLAGLTPLIPIPFLDEAAKRYFKRRMTRELAKARGLSLDAQSVKTLSDDPDTGCLSGCLLGALFYPIKWLFKKIFLLFGAKRAVDFVTRSYHQGYLIDYALEKGYSADAARARAGIDRVLTDTNTSLIEYAVRQAFGQSKGALRSAARGLQRVLMRLARRPTQEQIDQALESAEGQEKREVESLAALLQKIMDQVPPEHFERLRTSLDTTMAG